MEKLIFVCIKCGEIKEVFDSLDNLDDIVICPICDEPMQLKDSFPLAGIPEESDLLAEAIEADVIKNMIINLTKLGDEKCWEIIEGFPRAKMRGRFRKVFFQAGGVMPLREEII